eukprot:gnl/TRDRNA2_/TRDRNA2_114949_c0_seq1.p1 gnl/TRDRNA2_/TRDRNA2_114949_c0~~gnl/TRDRNA2_/TRDRNA2_114949_c0_seq1.p1  ORF type:complete len:414 (-),score=48.59 gnl/TRDRNA2_/TRDRNA2_114949_c0_seq1:80-1156(-)
MFQGADIIARVKRAERQIEPVETQMYEPGAILLGFLDSLDETTAHMLEWRAQGLSLLDMSRVTTLPKLSRGNATYTNARMPEDHIGNALAKMSRLAGRLAVEDAVANFSLGKAVRQSHLVVTVLGAYGSCGRAAAMRSLELFGGGQDRAAGDGGVIPGVSRLELRLVVRDPEDAVRFEKVFGFAPSSSSSIKLFHGGRTEEVADAVAGAHAIFAAARVPGAASPQLVGESELMSAAAGAIFVDLSLTEGGNVVYSRNDVTSWFCRQRRMCFESYKKYCRTGERVGRGRGDEQGDAAPSREHTYSDPGSDFVVIHSVTGFPKRDPAHASKLYSEAVAFWLRQLARHGPHGLDIDGQVVK